MSNYLHDSLIDRVEAELLRRGYDDIHREYEYDKGEVDLFAIRDNYVLLFEMKSVDNSKARRKAYEQLNRADRYLFRNKRVFKFYVSNVSNCNIKWYRK